MKDLDFNKSNGLIPAIIQDNITKDILMLGYMNKEALKKTKELGFVTFFSRSKNRLWTKGETSGNKLKLISIKEDCDNDSLLIKVTPSGPVCHKGSKSCFLEESFSLNSLEEIIKNREEEMPENSYVASLFKKGINKISQKVGEEATEVIIASLNESKESLVSELSDLFFHTLVLMREKKISLDEVNSELKKRVSYLTHK